MSVLRIPESEDRDLVSIGGKCRNSKINKFIEDINKKAFQRDIVLLLIDIAEKPDICIDYNISISYFLALYLKCKEEPILSDAGCLILNAAKIYARRVDNIHDCLQNTIASFENVSNIDNDKLHTDENVSKPKKTTKRTLPQQEYLQEYELSTKKFKMSTDEKLLEKEVTLGSFEPPQRYFTDLKRYLDWRVIKKKNKSSEIMHENFVDPTLWKYSSIEDFDYEDDIDTKRNYQVCTHIIEHRYSTLKNDIDFVMHFKVKDFVEAEEEDDAPARELSTLYKHSKNLSENIKNYIELENTILEKECRVCDNDNNSNLVCLALARRRRNRTENNSNLLEDDHLDNSISNTTETDTKNMETSIASNITDISRDITSNISNATLNDNTIEESIPQFENTLPVILSSADNNNTSIDESITQIENTVPDTQLNSDNSSDQISVPDLNDTTLSDNINIKNSSESFNPEAIIVRLSVDDEGVFFGDLDEVDRAMLDPRVVATDIITSMGSDIQNVHNLKVTVDEQFEKFFGIDESRLNLIENINIENSAKQHIEIRLNFLKIPERILRKRFLYRLGAEYDIYKNDRLKRRRCIEKPPRVTLLQLNNSFGKESPQHENDFLGFTEEEMAYLNDKNKNIENIKESFEKYRSISLDSGIALPDSLSNRVSVDNATSIVDKVNSIINENKNGNNLQSEMCSNLLSSTLIGTDAESPSFHDSGICSKNEENVSYNIAIDTPELTESHTQINDMIKKIQLWHRHLKPILAQSKTRHHFDIFELGTEIMNHFPTENSISSNKNVTFKTVMNNMDPSYISRYFLSMLLLANSNNISLNIINENENTDQPCDTDNIQLQLMNRKRHIVSVEDNIGKNNSKRICSNHESVLFPKPIQKIISTKSKINDDNDSGFYSETSFVTAIS